ncbi:MAG: transposase [Bacteroidetes bacterium]|nr:MAG: transposase [Bacteroidota bacterium]
MSFYKNKYLIETTRLRGYDYSSAGMYFVTICTKSMICYFGEIKNGEMCLNDIGSIVAGEWQRTPEIRPNIDLDEWIVMPNHIHGIIVIKDSVETPRRGVSTTWKPNSLGSIVNQIKSVSTKRIHSAGYQEFAWQPRFYDHIIRNERERERIRTYIRNNPTKWEKEKFETDANCFLENGFRA